MTWRMGISNRFDQEARPIPPLDFQLIRDDDPSFPHAVVNRQIQGYKRDWENDPIYDLASYASELDWAAAYQKEFIVHQDRVEKRWQEEHRTTLSPPVGEPG
jgi:hypothetical protein